MDFSHREIAYLGCSHQKRLVCTKQIPSMQRKIVFHLFVHCSYVDEVIDIIWRMLWLIVLDFGFWISMLTFSKVFPLYFQISYGQLRIYIFYRIGSCLINLVQPRSSLFLWTFDQNQINHSQDILKFLSWIMMCHTVSLRAHSRLVASLGGECSSPFQSFKFCVLRLCPMLWVQQ